ncbi:MAG: protein kinase, partial [Gammaproteobacteria bacterium]|nr:protein kinase [Gammaproteobacteria bacterium]
MDIAPGQQLAHYRLVEKLGEGGMGEVWRATDTKLDREVAIKILPAEFAEDAERLMRFEREAKLLASLNHPNIAAIYGLEEAEGVHFLVMELVAGEDLAERLARGPLSVDEALEIARQIALALEAAHDNGVIHRDLKPANVRLTPDGAVKVLDFGLAKAFGAGAISGDPALSPTMTSVPVPGGTTAAGMILGT